MRLLLIFLFILSGCSGEKNFELARKDQEARSLKSSAKIVSVQVVNDQLKISGTGLKHVENIKIKNDSGFNENFDIESISDSIIIANSLKNISILLGGVFDLVLSNAYAAASFEVGFTLQDGSVQASHLSTMGASTGQVLQFDGTDWVPGDLNSLVYSGEWDASSATEPNATPVGGEYYIVTTAGTNIDLLDGQGMRDWDVGDWIVYNSVTTQWDKIVSATGVASFNGRSGSVVPASGDYNIADLGDVDTTGIASGKILKWDGSDWVIADDEMSSGGGSGTGEATNVVLNADNDNNSSGEILFQTQGSTKAVIDNDGKIGVGTGAPENALHISKSSSQAGILLENTDGTAGGSYPALTSRAFNSGHAALIGQRAGGTKASPTIVAPSITLQTMVGSAHDGTSFKEVGRISVKSGDSFDAVNIDGKIEFQVRNNDVANTAMVIQETGSVGIGTPTPAEKLEVRTQSWNHMSMSDTAGGITKGYLAMRSPPASATSFVNLNINRDPETGVFTDPALGHSNVTIDALTTGGKVRFATSSAANTSATERMVIDENGLVGIGTTTPTEELEIVNNQAAATIINVSNSDTAGGSKLKLTGDDGAGFIGFYGSTNTEHSSRFQDRLAITALSTASGISFRTDQGNYIWHNKGISSAGYEAMRLESGRLGLDLGYNADASADFYTYVPPYHLTIGAYSIVGEKTVGVDRQTHPAIFGGHHLGLRGGGASVGSTDQNGGNLNLYSGTSTGTGSSSINFNTSTAQGGSNTTDNTPTTKMVIKGSGNVGIGTSNPGNILEIEGNSDSFETVMVKNVNTGTSAVSRFLASASGRSVGIETYNSNYVDSGLRKGNSAGIASVAHSLGIGISDAGGAYATSYINFYTGGFDATDERMRIDKNGNVGIGTTTPTSLLEVEGDVDGASSIRLRNDNVGTSAFSQLSVSAGAQTSYVYAFGDNYTTAGRYVQASSVVEANATGGLGISASHANGNIRFYTVNDNERMRIDNAGNVGIGTSAPTEKLHVAGDLRVQGSVTDCTLGAGSGATMCTSDIRLKDEVKNIENASEKLQQIRGVEFVWNHKSRAEGKKAMGVIAQEIEKVFPLAVAENSDGYKIVDYAVLVAPLIEVTNEQGRDIASLEDELTQLKKENSQMKAVLCELKPKATFCKVPADLP